MTRRGRKRRLVLEDEYWKLILDGVPTVEACRELGIGRKTGYRWRIEAGGLPPARVAEEVRSSRYLSLLERQRIATLRERGLGVREIARRISRSPSTPASCVGTSSRTTTVCMTPTWPTLVPETTPVASGPASSSATASCATW
jgi:Helix-turn-helix domain